MGFLERYCRYYLFGLRMGVLNLLRNGFLLGLRKTIGKVSQPITSFARYPEYDLFCRHLAPYLRRGGTTRILDIGSPKTFGLYLAYHYRAEVVSTDIDERNYLEFTQLWDCVKDRAKGTVRFEAVDGRRLPYADASFNAVYSMSVLEHIDLPDGDTQALCEMWRVLKGGGVQVVSVPVGSMYVEQYRKGFSYFEDVEDPRRECFFQKVYDKAAIDRAIPDMLKRLDAREICVHKRLGLILKPYLALGLNMRGLLGFLWPVFACLCCEMDPCCNAFASPCERYSQESRSDDIYSDLVMVWEKNTMMHRASEL